MPLLYQSPPNSGQNDGALPTTYVAGWERYVNLTPAQIVAFQGFPQDLTLYASTRRWLAEVQNPAISLAVSPGGIATTLALAADDRAKTLLVGMRQALDDGLITSVAFKDANGNFTTLDSASAKAVHQAVTGFIQQLYVTEQTLLAGIKATTIKTRKQVDAAIAVVAPNSPSATNPSPT